MQYLFVISGAFAALFSLLLFTRKQKELEHWFLAFMFLLVTVNCTYVFAFFTSTEQYYVPFFSELNFAIPLLYGPLFYFYTKALTVKDYEMSKIDYLHFLPFAAFHLIIVVPVFTSYTLPTTSQLGYPLIKLVITPFYLFSIIVIIRRYHKRFLEHYSYEQEVNLLWLNWIITGAVILWVIGCSSYIYNLFNEEDKILLYDYYTLSFLGVFLFGLAFVAFRKTDLFVHKEDSPRPEKFESDSIVSKIPSQPINEEVDSEDDSTTDISDDLDLLLKAMEEQKPHLDPLLTLNKLSSITSIPTYRLTKVLNSSIKSNFYDFINKYRVENVQKMLAEGQSKNLSLLGIATESGFNSKASFNRTFKKICGVTPSSYLKSIQGKTKNKDVESDT